MEHAFVMGNAHVNRDNLASSTGTNTRKRENLELGYQRAVIDEFLRRAGMLDSDAPQAKAATAGRP